MIIKTQKEEEYELIDSGNGEKLERYGSYLLSRPDPEALWEKTESDSFWEKADLKFIREKNKTKWIIRNGVPGNWKISYGGCTFSIRPTSFKHIGIFPEQVSNWKWMEKLIINEKQKPKILNLFAYTGGATMACAKAGAEVCHVDGSKSAVEWARDNAKLSGLEEFPIRWIIDDVSSFLKREIKRGRKYDAIIMDPPSFGHGPKDELWKIEEDFLGLMKLCKNVLSPNPLFFLINGYTAGYSPITYENNLKDMVKTHKGKIESGELVIEEKSSGKLLPCGIFARWERK